MMRQILCIPGSDTTPVIIDFIGTILIDTMKGELIQTRLFLQPQYHGGSGPAMQADLGYPQVP
jgi:hypothetical protein